MLQAQSRVDPQTVAVYPRNDPNPANANCPTSLPDDSHSGAINLDCFNLPDQTDATAYKKSAGEKDGTFRNRLASILMKQSDDVCTLELGRLTANEATVNTTLSILATSFATTSTIITGKTAKSILSGLAATSSASRGHINAEVYRNTLSTAVGRAIRLDRDRQKALLLANFVKTNKVYSVDQMVMDVNAYHQTCSFYYGLSLVVQAVDRTKFDELDRRRSMGTAIEDLDARTASLNVKLGDKSLSTEDQDAIKRQISELRDAQTALIKERAALTSATQGAITVTQGN